MSQQRRQKVRMQEQIGHCTNASVLTTGRSILKLSKFVKGLKECINTRFRTWVKHQDAKIIQHLLLACFMLSCQSGIEAQSNACQMMDCLRPGLSFVNTELRCLGRQKVANDWTGVKFDDLSILTRCKCTSCRAKALAKLPDRSELPRRTPFLKATNSHLGRPAGPCTGR
jgi:hypothetical protein